MPDSSLIASTAGDIATIVATVVSVAALFVAVRTNYRSELPQVIASLEFDIDKGCVFLVVQNIGKGAAYDVTFSGYDDAVIMEKFREPVLKSFLTKGIPILVPGAKRSTIVAAGMIMSKMKDIESPLVVTYSERGFILPKRTVSEIFTLDYGSFSGSLYVKSDLHLLRVAVEKMADK